jgi:hypothetical protein
MQYWTAVRYSAWGQAIYRLAGYSVSFATPIVGSSCNKWQVSSGRRYFAAHTPLLFAGGPWASLHFFFFFFCVFFWIAGLTYLGQPAGGGELYRPYLTLAAKEIQRQLRDRAVEFGWLVSRTASAGKLVSISIS